MVFLTTVTTLVMRNCRQEGFAKTRFDKYRLCHADKAKQGRNSCPWSPETSFGWYGCGQAYDDGHTMGLAGVSTLLLDPIHS